MSAPRFVRVVTAADAGTVRLRVPALRRWGPGTAFAVVGAVGVIMGLVGGAEGLAHRSSLTVTGEVLFGVLGLAGVVLGLWLVRTGISMARHRVSRLPVLVATAATIRLERPGRKTREVSRPQVAAARFEVRPPRYRGEATLASLEWLDADHRALGTWTVDPVIGSRLPRFLRAVGVELVPTDTPER